MRHKALIVDDERLARRELSYLLQAHPQIEVVAEADSVDSAITALKAAEIDIVFLDIQMAGGSGFDLFLRTRPAAHVVFVTAHDEHALRAFEVDALDYLVKPVHSEHLRRAIERFLERRLSNPSTERRLAYDDSILLSIDGAPRFLKLSAIASIRADGDYTRLAGTSGPIGMVLKSLKAWEQVLPERQFCRIARSAIVNSEQVARLEPWFGGGYRIHLRGVGEPLVMSRRCARQFRGRFGV